MEVLIVDDEEYILEQSKHYLEKENSNFEISSTLSAS